MIVSWMLYALLAGVLVAAGARALEEVCGLIRLPRRFVWLGALLATLVLVALAPLRVAPQGQRLPLDAAGQAALPGEVVPADAVAHSLGVAEALAALQVWVERPLRAAMPLGDGSTGMALALGWIVLSLAMLALGAATLLRFRGARRRWPRCEVAGTEVRVSPVAGPAVIGFLRPEIVIPEWLLRASPEERWLVVLHEAEHRRARDPLVLAAGCLALALIPWNAVAWWMLHRLRLAVEVDCDARVLRRGVRPFAYGSLLIDLAGRGSGLPPGVPALAGTPSTLERRLRSMTARVPRFAALRAGALSVLGVAALLAACEARLPTSSEVEAMDVAAAETQLQRWRIVSPERDTVIYIVNGVEVSAEEARALAGDRIAQVEVMRGHAAEGARIRIETRPGEHLEGHAREAKVRELALPPPDAAGHPHVLQFRQGEPGFAGPFEGLILIDGVRAQPSELRGLRPDRIERIEVLKGDAATRQYDDPAAAKGVLRITTRSGAESR